MEGSTFQDLLGGVMLGAALLVAAGPERLWKSRDTAPISSPAVRWVLCLAIGLYGGMVQAGVGYLILAALTLLLAMELLRTI